MKEIKKADVTSLYTADNIVGTEDGMDVKAFYKKVYFIDLKMDSDVDDIEESQAIVTGGAISVFRNKSNCILRLSSDSSDVVYGKLLSELGTLEKLNCYNVTLILK